MAERTGLPFTNVRLLRRLVGGPRSISELAELASIDAPAATVAVNELERRNLVTRRIDPDNRRRKIVSLTADGGALITAALQAPNPAPEAFEGLSDDEVELLCQLLVKLESAD